MMVIAIDPGTVQSAILQWDGVKVQEAVILDNEQCRIFLRSRSKPFSLAVEMVACYGMAVGKEVFETCLQVGRIQEIACHRNIPLQLVYRREVKMHLCNSMKAKDSNIRQALVDRFGPPGTTKQRGALYGIKSHLWAALGVAVFYMDTSKPDDDNTRNATPNESVGP